VGLSVSFNDVNLNNQWANRIEHNFWWGVLASGPGLRIVSNIIEGNGRAKDILAGQLRIQGTPGIETDATVTDNYFHDGPNKLGAFSNSPSVEFDGYNEPEGSAPVTMVRFTGNYMIRGDALIEASTGLQVGAKGTVEHVVIDGNTVLFTQTIYLASSCKRYYIGPNTLRLEKAGVTIAEEAGPGYWFTDWYPSVSSFVKKPPIGPPVGPTWKQGQL
jgi:hypothetical protein